MVLPHFQVPKINDIFYLQNTGYNSLQNVIDEIKFYTGSYGTSESKYQFRGGGQIFVPSDFYYITGSHIIHSFVSIIGANERNSLLSWESDSDTGSGIPSNSAKIIVQPTFMELDSGVLNAGIILRDLYLKGSYMTGTEQKTCFANQPCPYTESDGTSSYGGFTKLMIERTNITDWGKHGVYLNSAGWGTQSGANMFHTFKDSNIARNASNITLLGDNRIPSFNHVYMGGAYSSTSSNRYGLYVSVAYNLSVINGCCSENCYTGLDIHGTNNLEIQDHYIEENTWGIVLSVASCPTVKNIFNYSTWIPFYLIDIYNAEITNVRALNMGGYFGTVSGHINGCFVHNNKMNGTNSAQGWQFGNITGSPYMWEKVWDDNTINSRIIMGMTNFSGLNDGSGSSLILRTKTTSGQPTESCYAQTAGSQVYNSNEDRMYIFNGAVWKYWTASG